MTPLEFFFAALAVSIAAGVLGSVLGLGGGIIVVPALTLLFDVDIRLAIGASIVSVIATSSGAAAAYVREGLTNLRVAMFLEIGTTTGALIGAYLAGVFPTEALYVIFGVMLGYSALMMFRRREDVDAEVEPDAWSDQLGLHGEYHDRHAGVSVRYRVARSRVGLALMAGAGMVSGLLGIGSGALKVPAMDLAMRLPMKVSTATSNFMIGVTAAASAGVYFARGDISPFVAAPVALGVASGAFLGARLLHRLSSTTLRTVFVVVLGFIAAQMIVKGL